MTSCNKYHEKKESHYPVLINDSIKSLFFNIGTYWVYMSDTLSHSDSTFIYGVQTGFYEVGTGHNSFTDFEYYSMDCQSRYSVGKSKKNKYFIDRSHLQLNPVVGYPSANGDVLYSVEANSCPDWEGSVIYFDSLHVGNYTFYRVQESKFSSRWGGDTIFTYYTAPYVGIVKKTITTDSITNSWNIVRWKIVK